jgi:hypothetical protein
LGITMAPCIPQARGGTCACRASCVALREGFGDPSHHYKTEFFSIWIIEKFKGAVFI